MNKEAVFSPLIAGTMNWGSWGKKLDTAEMEQLIHQCVEMGISSFDHADIYGDYTNEAAFGMAFKKSSLSREKIQLISKCGIQLLGGRRNNPVKYYDYSKEYIYRSVEQSLKHLDTDYLDLFLLHRPSPLMQPEDIAAAVTELKKQGKIRAFGVSNFTPAQTDLIQSAIKVEYNQIEFSLTHHQAMTDGTLDHMQLHQIRPMSWAPLGKVLHESNTNAPSLKETITRLALQYGVNEAGLLIAWIMKHPAEILPIFGTTDIKRIMALKKAVDINMSNEDWFLLWTAGMNQQVP